MDTVSAEIPFVGADASVRPSALRIRRRFSRFKHFLPGGQSRPPLQAAWNSQKSAALVLFPIKASADGFVPAAQELFASFLRHFRLEGEIAVPEAPELVTAFPDADSESCEVSCAQRRRFADDGSSDLFSENVRLELHQKPVAAGPAVDS